MAKKYLIGFIIGCGIAFVGSLAFASYLGSLGSGIVTSSSTMNTYTAQNPSCAAGQYLTYASSTNTLSCSTPSGGGVTTTINGTQASLFYLIGTGNVTSTVAGATTTFSLTGVIPSANGGTNTTTALGSNAFNSTAYLPLTGGTLSGNVTGTTATFNNLYDASGNKYSTSTGGSLTPPVVLGSSFYNNKSTSSAALSVGGNIITGGGTPTISITYTTTTYGATTHVTSTFAETGAVVSTTLPGDLDLRSGLAISAIGGTGGDGCGNSLQGEPGMATGTYMNASGMVLWVNVAGGGSSATNGAGGYNGGGSGGSGSGGTNCGGGGGGYTSLSNAQSITVNSVILIAAGGGGGGGRNNITGTLAGAGGGTNGGNGTACTGDTQSIGATQTAGGTPGSGTCSNNGGTGSQFTGGTAGNGTSGGNSGGGGGGGFWGGAGGEGANEYPSKQGNAGSGGSSYSTSSVTSFVTNSGTGFSASANGSMVLGYYRASSTIVNTIQATIVGTNEAGTITMGNLPYANTSTVMVFATSSIDTFGNTPSCTMTPLFNSGGNYWISNLTSSSVTFNWGTGLNTTSSWNYTCLGY